MKRLKLKDVLPYMDITADVILFQEDLFVTPSEEHQAEEYEVFKGSVMDIPWIYLDYYLSNMEEGEAIAIEKQNDRVSFYIIIKGE